MSTLASDIERSISSLDSKSAAAVEVLLSDILRLVHVKAKAQDPDAQLDANGWPVGHFQKFVGCLAGEEWEPSPDPPPEPSPEW